MKSQIGLGNADNTSDADKPISTAMQNALNGKADIVHTHSATDITNMQGFLDNLSVKRLSVGECSLAFGNGASATADDSIAMGYNAQATSNGKKSIAIGNGTTSVSDERTFVMGNNCVASNSSDSVMIGKSNTINNSSTPYGDGSDKNIIIGVSK